jgi:hypothetical protein
LDEVVAVAAAEAPKSSEAIQFALFEEIRALRRAVEDQRGVMEVSLGPESCPNLF